MKNASLSKKNTGAAAVALLACAIAPAFAASTPYVVPTNPAVGTQAILTVGESVNFKPDGVTPYVMVGIPDGLGAYDNGDGTFTVLMNHELGNTVGVVRAHGNKGAFVSEWIINKSDLSVVSIRDFIGDSTSIFLSDNVPGTSAHTGFEAGATTAINRLCSADLAAPTAYQWTDVNSGITYGTSARIFQSGEESGFGRQFAWIATDDPNTVGNDANLGYEIPHCGLFSWENNVANPYSQRKTIVMGMDDTNPGGQIYVWVGDKQTTGNVVERAGLTRQSVNDNLYVIKVNGLPPDTTGATLEDRATPLNGTFALMNEGDVSGLTGTQLETLSNTKGGTKFLRPEDGSWDPSSPVDYYFVTTDRYDQVKDGVGAQVGRSRLYRLRFTDIANPELGGAITCLLDGTEAGNMFDNLTVDHFGRVILQEDVGNQQHNGKIWMYQIATGQLVQLAQHNPALFGGIGVPAIAPFNQDEESSGIIDVSEIFGPGYYLLDVQAHYSIPGELVEGGQFLAMYIPVAPTVQSVQINDGSAQRSKVNEVTITINGVIPQANIAAGAFTLTRTQGGTYTANLKSLSTVGRQTFVTLGFAGTGLGTDGALPDGSYTLRVDSTKITDELGQNLDSDRDGKVGGPVAVIATFGTLFGDLNGDGAISGQEVAVSAHANGTKIGDADYRWYLDYDANGVINGKDHREVARRNNGN